MGIRIPDKTMEITDTRTVLDFQKTTFCGHVRAHVIKVLLQNIGLGHPDYACYWTLELLASGLVHTLWMTLFEGAALHINRGNPAVFLYLSEAYERFAPLEAGYSAMAMTAIRNNLDARRIVCEAAATVSLCRKNKLPTLPTIKPHHDFDQITIQEHMKAPSVMYGKAILRRDDPLPTAIAVNEFMYALRSDVRDVTRALYWLAWTFGYCREHKKQYKQPLVFSNRQDTFVSSEHGGHVVWLFWEAIHRQCPPMTKPYIDALYRMYCLRWSPAEAKARQPMLTAAIVLVCEGTTLDTTPVSGQSLVVSNLLQGIPAWIDAILRMQKSFSSA